MDTLGVRRVRAARRDQPVAPLAALPHRKSRLEIVAIGASDTYRRQAIPSGPSTPRSDARRISAKLLAGRGSIDPNFEGFASACGIRSRRSAPFSGAQAAKRAGFARRPWTTSSSDGADRQARGEGTWSWRWSSSLTTSTYDSKKRILVNGRSPTWAARRTAVGFRHRPGQTGSASSLAGSGCRVVVLVDAVHEIPGSSAWENGHPASGSASSRRRPTPFVFIASDHGPSSPDGSGPPDLRQGVLDVLKAKNAGRLRKRRKPGALRCRCFDFQRTVTRRRPREDRAASSTPSFYLPELLLVSRCRSSTLGPK